MKDVDASTVDEFIVNTARQSHKLGTYDHASAVAANTSDLLAKSIESPRYHAQNNRTAPRKIGSHLHLWDCINCDKCIPVCPNDANFYFEIEPVEILYNNIKIMEEGWAETEGGVLKIEESHQLATFSDACNDCGNCDVFCPEDGGPYIEKPRFFGSLDTWRKWNRLSGFVLTRKDRKPALYGRFKDKEYELRIDERSRTAIFHVDGITVSIDWGTYKVLDIKRRGDSVGKVIDMGHLLSMGILLKGMLDTSRIHFVNVGMIA
jgi:putative selenate reductase